MFDRNLSEIAGARRQSDAAESRLLPKKAPLTKSACLAADP
jgi:hypothetical protein